MEGTELSDSCLSLHPSKARISESPLLNVLSSCFTNVCAWMDPGGVAEEKQTSSAGGSYEHVFINHLLVSVIFKHHGETHC